MCKPAPVRARCSLRHALTSGPCRARLARRPRHARAQRPKPHTTLNAAAQRSPARRRGRTPRANPPSTLNAASTYLPPPVHWAHGSLALRQHAAPRATRAKSLIPIWGGPVEAVVLARIKREETGARGAHAAASTHCRSRVTDLQDHGRHTTTHRPPQALYGSPRSRARSLTTTASREAAPSRRSGAARRCGPSSSSASPAPSRSSSSAASSARCWAAATARRRLR